MEIGDAESFVAYPSRWRRGLLALLSLGFVTLGLWMVGTFGPVPTSRRYPYMETLIIGWVCLIFFGLCAAAYVPKLIETGEQLRIDASGIRFSQWSHLTIPWEEISGITNWSYRRSRFIVLHLSHPERFPGKGLGALLAGTNRRMTGGDICISLTGMDRRYDEAIAAISRYKRLA